MKRIILITMLAAVLSSVTFAGKLIAEGKTFTSLGDYRIELADRTVPVKGEDCKAFIISYENSPMELTVAVCKGKKCKRYVVLSDKLSVQYVCNEFYFGVEKLDKEFQRDGYSTSDSALNRGEYFHQKVLARGETGELEATQMIAAYFPMLINTEAEVTALK